ncbi:hypothetical protein [Verrucosispora sioxanthis]|uniref:Uncharacterized protein n=1 Tax=Verrucosispora sioxanthis TaxID=2499994 RepID=A0A6M1KVK2_9ACTN|nr:hypothetical protein [Verrucosispora sioxanthis]NEE62949.1 hypothetical protein [Verrucosispora sioxanthis]NGM12059.1 hypothetical protein [Verrucosispora sioxanthis]
MSVIHHPRVAWDTARTLVGAVPDDERFRSIAGELERLLGGGVAQSLRETRDRLRSAPDDGRDLIEAGVWRVRIEDALRSHPDAVEPLRRLTTHAQSRSSSS